MKKTSLLLMVALTTAAISCSKTESGTPEPSPSPTPTPTPVDNTTSIVVKAPVLADGTKMKWKTGDVLVVGEKVKGAAFYKMTAQSDGDSVVFKGEIPKTMTSFKAFFPAANVLANPSTTNIHFVWSGMQQGSAGEIVSGTIPMVCNGEKIRDGFSFKPVASALKFSIAGSDIVSVTVVVGSSDADYVAADVINVNTGTLNTSTNEASSISRSLTMTPATGSAFTPGEYCFGLLSKASARTIAGYKLTYRKTDGSTIIRESTDALSIVSGGVCVIPGNENTEAYKSSKISGKVTDSSTGAGIAGIPVSDGLQIVRTGADGSYSFSSDLTRAQNVFVIMPSEYEFSFNEYGGWDDHRLIDASRQEQSFDFALTRRSSTRDKYRILLLGDPQQMSSRPHSSKAWAYVCDAINAYRTSVSEPLYQISMGDMVTNEIEVAGKAEAYLATQKTSGVRTFSIPGNHDHVQKASTYYASVAQFSRWFGPYNYAFNLGKQHFIFLDSCAWCEGSGTYSERLNEQGLTFLEQDLALVDIDTPVHIFTHCPLTKKQGGGFPTTTTYHTRMFNLLAGRCVNMWYGHIHTNVNYSYTAAELQSKAPGVKSLDSHLVARCGGCWSCSGEICMDGSPRGFVELDIDGTSSHWQYHSIDSRYPHDFNTYLPGQFAGENLTKVDDSALYCNVYMWDNAWSSPEVWINGSKAGDMTKVKINADSSYDPLYQHFYVLWKAEGLMDVRDEPPASYDCTHLFKYVPAAGVKKVEIRLKDRWDETQTREIQLTE